MIFKKNTFNFGGDIALNQAAPQIHSNNTVDNPREQQAIIDSKYHKYITGLSPLLHHDIMNLLIYRYNKNNNSNHRKKIFKMNLTDTEMLVDIKIEHLENVLE